MCCTDCSLGEVSATSKDSKRNMCTSHSRTQLSNHNDHVSVDNSRRQAACTVCNKRLHPASMSRHMRRHLGDQLFTCVLCKREFSDRNQLYAHECSHAAEHELTRGTTEWDFLMQYVRDVDFKDAVSATNTDSNSNMCAFQSTPQLSSCNDHVSVDSSGHQHSHTMDRSKHLSVRTVCGKSLINCNCKKLFMCTYSGKWSFCCNVCSKIVCSFHTFITTG